MMRQLAVLPFLFAACASSSELNKVPAPEAEQHELEVRKAEERRRDINFVLVRLDQAIDSYVQALSNQGEIRADRQAERLERSIQDMVMDPAGPAPGENYRKLQAIATDASVPSNQAIALAALGFSGQLEVMPTILQGAQLSDPFRVDHAVLGLAMLQSPATPPGVLAAIIERKEHPEDGRVQAAWALYRIQTVCEHPEDIVAIWRHLLTDERDTLPIGVLVTAVRGLGSSRDAANSSLVAGFLRHPTPRLRMAAAIALARMNAQDRVGDLIELLGPQETVQNVRLHARKALADLAGGADYGYDVQAWRKAFDRGQ
ncbi:MAG TPA: HEAT repeat domain-containing protein [Planctomycetota bacterium]|nr:HEAT repeat domain-containing protein [Planctomycetota bacterium]